MYLYANFNFKDLNNSFKIIDYINYVTFSHLRKTYSG